MAGWLLVVGSAAFLVGALNPALAQVWSAAPEAQLRLIHDNATAWIVTSALFLIATAMTAAGLWFVPERAGTRGLIAARAAVVVYLFGSTAWLASLAFRLTVTPDAAASLATTGSMDPTYVLMDRWADGLFGAFTYLAGGSLAALGVALLVGHSLSAVAGWFETIIGLVIVGGYALAGDMPPFVAYLPTGLLGIVMLRQRTAIVA